MIWPMDKRTLRSFKAVRDFVYRHQKMLRRLTERSASEFGLDHWPAIMSTGRCTIWPCVDAYIVVVHMRDKISVAVRDPVDLSYREFTKAFPGTRLVAENGAQHQIDLDFDNLPDPVRSLGGISVRDTSRGLTYRPNFDSIIFIRASQPLPHPEKLALQYFDDVLAARNLAEVGPEISTWDQKKEQTAKRAEELHQAFGRLLAEVRE